MIAFVTHFLILSSAFASASLPQSDPGGFSVELIHRDSPKSLFHDPSKTPLQHLTDSAKRSITRANRFKPTTTSPTPNSPQASLLPNEGEYLMKFSVGTPPTETIGIVDTGIDLTWTRCEPCPDCHTFFNPQNSSTYKQIPCNSTVCYSIGSFCDSKETCQYMVSYNEGMSYSIGDIAADTVTLSSANGQSASLNETFLGCERDGARYFKESGNVGNVGLGAGPASILIQKGSAFGSKKFSYCLASNEQARSTINFGNVGIVSGPGVVSTPLIINRPDYHYQLTVEAISVGSERFELPKNVQAEANAAIDSGTMATHVPPGLYYPVKSAVEKAIRLPSAPGVEFMPCYLNTSYFEAPIITVHFKGGDLQLNTSNTFIQVSENTTCFASLPTSNDFILGNVAQRNFLVGYDLEEKTLSFKSTGILLITTIMSDSPKSPFYSLSETPFQHLIDSFECSINISLLKVPTTLTQHGMN